MKPREQLLDVLNSLIRDLDLEDNPEACETLHVGLNTAFNTGHQAASGSGEPPTEAVRRFVKDRAISFFEAMDCSPIEHLTEYELWRRAELGANAPTRAAILKALRAKLDELSTSPATPLQVRGRVAESDADARVRLHHQLLGFRAAIEIVQSVTQGAKEPGS